MKGIPPLKDTTGNPALTIPAIHTYGKHDHCLEIDFFVRREYFIS